MVEERFVYLAITCDKYELPIAVFDNLKQIASYANTTYASACCMVMRKTYNRQCKCKFIKVDLEKEE